jgi:DNA-directed RNA polymerase II subunit RPB2
VPHVALGEGGGDKVKVADAEAMRQLARATCTPIVCVPMPRAAATRVNGFDLESTAAGSKMQPEGIKSAKWFPSWCWLLGQREMRAVIDGLRRANGRWAGAKKVICTSSVRFRDELMRMLLTAGYTARFRCEYTAGTNRASSTERAAIVARHDSWCVMYAENDKTGSKSARPVLYKARGDIREREYTGRVWCFTMPSGFVWARRAHKNAAGVVTKASRPLIIGNCGTPECECVSVRARRVI